MPDTILVLEDDVAIPEERHGPAAAFLQKPFTMDPLLRQMRELLR